MINQRKSVFKQLIRTVQGRTTVDKDKLLTYIYISLRKTPKKLSTLLNCILEVMIRIGL